MSSENYLILDSDLLSNTILSEENYEKICRTCFKEKNNSISIFSTDIKFKKSYANLIMEIAPIIILEEEKNSISPCTICKPCVKSLCNLYKFQQQCIQVNNIIQSQNEKLIKKEESESECSFRDNDDTLNQYDFEKSESGSGKENVQNLSEKSSDTDVKPHLCNTCNGAFSSSNELEDHIKEAHDEKEDVPLQKRHDVEIKLDHKQKIQQNRILLKTHCKSKPNYCDTCNKTYASQARLLEHLKRVHGANNKISCNICKKTFPNKQFLKKHKHLCESCGEYSEDGNLSKHDCSAPSNNEMLVEELIKMHCKTKPNHKQRIQLNRALLKKHCKTKPNYCDTCDKTYTSYTHLLEHVKRVHKPNKTSCNICNKTFPSKQFLKKHKHLCESCGEYSEDGDLSNHNCTSPNEVLIEELIKLHCKTEPNHCDTCNKSYKSKRSISLHVWAAHSGTGFPCDVCNKLFSHGGNLKRHKKLHLGIKEHMCECCGKKFAQKGELLHHVRANHADRIQINGEGRKMPEFKCLLCEQILISKKSFFSHHFQAHNGENIPCWICGKKVADRYLLNEHLTTHDGHNRYKCKYCPKTFTHSPSLHIHERSHTGERPFKCKLCEKAFTQQPHLRAHELIHTGEKPFKCKFCPKSFRHQTTYLQHKRIHTGERPYRCKVCDKGFYHSTNMKKHAALHFKV